MKLARVLGIDIKVNPLLLLVFPAAYFIGMLTDLLLVFGVLLLHEAGHAAAARLCNIAVLEMELLPFGGVARLDSRFEIKPSAEIFIACAGPAVNLILAMLTALLARYAPIDAGAAEVFVMSNLTVMLFNCMPALPMDGGRVLRALLSGRFGVRNATRATAITGMALGGALVALGIVAAAGGVINITLFITGPSLAFSAWRAMRTAELTQLTGLIEKKSAFLGSGALPIKQLAIHQSERVNRTVERFSPRYYHVVTVMDDNMRTINTLSEDDLTSALLDNRGGEALASVGRH